MNIISENKKDTDNKYNIIMERNLIEYCSPALASIKTGNIFTFSYENDKNLNDLITDWNLTLKSKGISITVLRKSNNKALLYVYRKDKLKKDFQKSGVARFLGECGYTSTNVDYAVERLKQRLTVSKDFPHEIGLFLSYPLGDVIGFIANSGQNCKCTGYWKVYCNLSEAERIFEKFNKCRAVYRNLWQQGQSIQQLVVSC